MVIARGHARRIAAQEVSQDSNSDERLSNSRKADFKATVTFLLITGVFGVAFVPYYASVLYVVVNLRWPNSTWMFVLKILGISNTWMNALIYYFRNKWFQKELKQLLLSCR